MLPALQIEEVHWELTNHCNLACLHCYLAPDARRELSTAEILGIIDQIHEAGVLYLTFSGGEPLLRKDFLEIYRYAHDLGFLITVFTNGTKFTPQVFDEFKMRLPFKVEITLNGITKETFEKVTDRSGSFEKCMAGIAALCEAGIRLVLKTNGMTLNEHEVHAIKAFAQSLPNTSYKFDSAIMPRRDHDLAPIQYRLNPKRIVEIYKKDKEMDSTAELACKSVESASDRSLFSCTAAASRFHISAWGDLHPCHTVRPLYVSLLGEPFLRAARKLNERVTSLEYPAESKCVSCKIFSECDNCPGLAHLEKKSNQLLAEYHCDVAHTITDHYVPEVLV